VARSGLETYYEEVNTMAVKKGFDLTKRVDVDEDMSQNDIVLKHLEEYRTITALEGLRKYSIGNVQGRIADLRLRGHKITTHQSDPHDFATYEVIETNE
jgi:hypothetical protein